MDPAGAVVLGVLAVIAFLMTMRSVRQVNQWETGLKFRLGKLVGRSAPGLNIVIPGVERLVKIDTRVRNRDLPQQSVITADNVTAWIDAVIYYKVVDAEKAMLNVQDFETAVRDRAKVVLRDVVGETKLDDLLAHREEVAAKVRLHVEQFVAAWGLHVELIALQDIQLPQQMQEVIAKKAIAERDKQYVIIKSQADLESAKNFAQAARILFESPGAMELRRLEALQNLSGGTSKVIFDLAKPGGADARAAAMASAMQESNVRIADEKRAAQGEEEAGEFRSAARAAASGEGDAATLMRVTDELLRRRALELTGEHGDETAREALENGQLDLERDVSEWEGSSGTVHGHRVVVVVPPEMIGSVAASLNAQDALSWAIAAALSERGGEALFDVRYEAATAPISRPGGGPYRSGA